MRHINRVTLLSHAGDDSEIRSSPGGGRAGSFSLVHGRAVEVLASAWRNGGAPAAMLTGLNGRAARLGERRSRRGLTLKEFVL